MLFLIEYNRHRGEIVNLRTFADSERRTAESSRLTLELELNRQAIEHEVVLLEAIDEAALRRTHRRYFETLDDLARAS